MFCSQDDDPYRGFPCPGKFSNATVTAVILVGLVPLVLIVGAAVMFCGAGNRNERERRDEAKERRRHARSMRDGHGVEGGDLNDDDPLEIGSSGSKVLYRMGD
jgi:hypothetical protein